MQRCSEDRLQGGDGVPQVEFEEDVSLKWSDDCLRGKDGVKHGEGGVTPRLGDHLRDGDLVTPFELDVTEY